MAGKILESITYTRRVSKKKVSFDKIFANDGKESLSSEGLD